MDRVRIERFSAQRLSALLLIALGLVAGGCGTDRYERTMIQRAKELKHESAFRKLDAEQQVPGTALWIRLPEEFHNKPLRAGNKVAGRTVDEQRVLPQVVEVPGLAATYEAMIPESDGPEDTVRKVACYCHVLQVRYRAGMYYDPGENIRRQLLEKDIEISPQWTDADCPTPEGRRITWKKLHATAEQPFYTVQGDGPGKIERMPGAFDVYLRREGDYVVGLVWRVPDAVRARIEWPKFAELTGGCLALKPDSATPPGEEPTEQVAAGEPGEEPTEPGQEPSGPTQPETPSTPGPGETASTPTPEGPDQPEPTPGTETPGGSEPAEALQLPADAPELIDQSTRNLEQIAQALGEYHRRHGQFPPTAPYVDRGGKPLLSWRVALLPFLDKDDLHREFHLGEPWDSPHNLKMADRMPRVFQTPGGPAGTKTCYLAAVGPGTALATMQGSRRELVSDGAENTLIVVEADPDRAVVWTQPVEWPFVPAQPNDALGRLRGDFFLGLAVDGSVHRVPVSAPAEVLRAAFTSRGGEPFQMGNFEGLAGSTPGSPTGPTGPAPGEPGGEAPSPTDLVAQARAAFGQGQEQHGVILLKADAVVRLNPEVLGTLRWFPAGKEPRLALRWALALEAPQISGTAGTQPGSGQGLSTDQMIQYWDEKLLQPLGEQLQTRVTQGRFGTWLTEVQHPSGTTQQEIERRPGIVVLKASELEKIRSLAQQEQVDLVLLGRIRPRRVPSGPTQSVIQFVVLNAAADQRLWTSGELNNRRIEAAEQGEIQATPVEDMLAEITERVDREFVLVDMPRISREAALGRAESLVGLAADRPLTVLVELCYYQWKELLTAEEVSALFQQVLGPEDGARLASGTPEERLEVVERWIPEPPAP